MARRTPPLFGMGLALSVCTGAIGSGALAQGGDLTLPQDPGGSIELVHPEIEDGRDPAAFLQVFVGAAERCCADRSPLAGHYTLDGDSVIFDPAFELVTGQTYSVMALDGGTQSLTEFTLAPDRDVIASEVVAIYPSGPQVPENTLRFYIHFATPMQPHMSADFIQLLDATGTPDTAAFMTFTQELWNEDRTRLTLLMDPGRIKRGVAQNLELGPALLEGQRHSIVVVEGWHSANGQHEAPRFEHHFTVSAPLRDLPDTDLWHVTQPAALTRDPLMIAFDRPFDHQLAQASIRVFGPDGQVLPGATTLTDFERTWCFTPDDPWPPDTIQIIVDARLEDVAGNNFRDLMDHAVEVTPRDIDQIALPLTLVP